MMTHKQALQHLADVNTDVWYVVSKCRTFKIVKERSYQKMHATYIKWYMQYKSKLDKALVEMMLETSSLKTTPVNYYPYSDVATWVYVQHYTDITDVNIVIYPWTEQVRKYCTRTYSHLKKYRGGHGFVTMEVEYDGAV